MRQLLRLSSVLLATVLGLAGCDDPVPEGELSGSVFLVGPIESARIRVENQNGDLLCTTFSDASGHWSCLGPFEGLLTVEADGEHLSYRPIYSSTRDEDTNLGDSLFATVTDFAAGAHMSVTVSPLTALASGIGEARFAAGKDGSRSDAAAEAYRLVGAHFGFDLEVEPANVFGAIDPTRVDDPAVRHGLALAALDHLAFTLEVVGRDNARLGTSASLIWRLLVDLGPGETVLDGERDGGPVASGTCVPELFTGTCNDICQLGGHTLRTDVARALAQLLERPYNLTGLTGADVAGYAESLAAPGDAELFDAAADAGCVPDLDAPVITTSQELDGDDVVLTFAVTDPSTRAGHFTLHVDSTDVTYYAPDVAVANGGFPVRIAAEDLPARVTIRAYDVVGYLTQLEIDVPAPPSPAP